ncbi:MAG: cytochrome c3 family protein, partial [Phycisphaerae bacterium]
NCHTKQAGAYIQGVHALAEVQGNPNAPTCSTCHGGHDILPAHDRQSHTYPLNIVKICGDCHEKHLDKDAAGRDGKAQVSRYLESVHGKAVTKAGMAVAATCASCHGAHDVLPAKNPKSAVNRAHVPETCGKCHVGVTELYETSVHGTLLGQGSKEAPVCSDCHTAHAITRTDSLAFTTDIVAACGSCHDKPAKGSKEKASLYETYRASYHGQVTKLGSARAARCSDCHGAHNIRRIADPLSQMNAQNKVGTCRKCHPGVDAKFASFAPHADFRNSDRYPLLHYVYLYFVIMMSASFGFFGLHCILWFTRSVIERIKHGPHPKPDYSKSPAIQRFNRVDRLNHGLVIVSFFGLALTGLPLFYSDKPWAQALANLFGGPSACGVEHRIYAIMLICNFLIHAVGVVRRFRKHGTKQMLFGPTSMLPRVKDLQDSLGMFRWFFVGGAKPKFDRWTYWEKFDYMAEVGGSGIIGVTGLLLWFPVFFSAFVPGWAFNVATVIHGFEALLAVGFIFTIHFFNAHLRLEKFPVDDVMFTGRLPEEEFKHERGAEYERAVASGEIAKLRVAPPPAWYRHFAVAMGITAMTIGTTIAVLIILAALKIL